MIARAAVALATLAGALGCGFTVHMAVTHRAVNYFVGSEGYAPLLLENRGALEAGSPYPDYFYQCGSNHDDGEYTHWAPYQWHAANFIRTQYPRPWAGNGNASILAAFHFGVVSHSIADISWHGLQYFPTHYGLIETIGMLDFNCSGDLCSPAHTLADTGGEFVAAFATALPWDDPNTWVIPAADLIAILRSDNRTEQESDIGECAAIFYAGSEAIRTIASLVEPLEVQQSPTLGEVFLDLPVGGLDDMAAYATRLWQRWALWLDQGPPATPPGGEYCPGICSSEDKRRVDAERLVAREQRAIGQKTLKSLYRILAPSLLDAGLVNVSTFGGVITIERVLSADGGMARRQAVVLAYLRRLLEGGRSSGGSWENGPRAAAGWTSRQAQDTDPEAVASLLAESLRLAGMGPALDSLIHAVSQQPPVAPSFRGSNTVPGPKARVLLRLLDAALGAHVPTTAPAVAAEGALPIRPNATAIFASELELEYAGAALAVGDYNADGAADIALGAYGHGSSGKHPNGNPARLPQAGAFYVRYSNAFLNESSRIGGKDDSVQASPLTEAFPSVTESGLPYTRLGAALCTLDLNSDGVDDLAVSAPTYGWDWTVDPWDEAPQWPYVGAVFVYFGRNVTGLPASPDVILTGPRNHTHTGTTLVCGDLNGDGRTDLVIGSPHALAGNGAVTQGGRLDVFLSAPAWGSGGAVPQRVSLDAANYSWEGASIGAWLGYSAAVAPAGAAGGVTEAELLWLLHDSSSPPAAREGSSLGSAADGATLLLVGSPGFRALQPNGMGPAAVGRVLGFAIPHAASPAGAVAASLAARRGAPLSPAPLFTITADSSLMKGPAITPKLGHGVAIGLPAGGNGSSSISPVVLALGMTGIDFCGSSTSLPGWDNFFNSSFNTSAGSVTLLTLGSALRGDLMWSAVTGALAPALNATVLASNLPDARFGWRVAFADVDADGSDELLVGAPMWEGPGGADSGREAGTLLVYRGGNNATAAWPGLESRAGLPGAAVSCNAVDAAWARMDGQHEFGRFSTSFAMGRLDALGPLQLLVSAPRASEPVPPQVPAAQAAPQGANRDGAEGGGDGNAVLHRSSRLGSTSLEMPGAVYAFSLTA